MDESRDVPVHLVAVAGDIPPGAEKAELFSGEEDETDRPSEPTSCRDGPGSLHDQGAVDAIVERSRSELPRIQVRAQEHDLLRFLDAADLGDDITGTPGSADMVLNLQRDLELAPLLQ